MPPDEDPHVAGRLPKLIEKSRRGKLKIYIGHAAGVGKTYQMLEDAHLLKTQGVDVVVGFVETHGRAETAAKIGDLEVVPRRAVRTRGRTLEEMDLPAILARRPEVVLVDELAHTNVPGVENEKRYQDVEDILAAGISVMTTVNIQHFESVQDIVSRVTGVDVRERVPDRLLRQADAIVNVDLPSEELREARRPARSTPPSGSDAALENFFTEENLASLRELAMRQIADRLEAERRGPDQLGGGGAGRRQGHGRDVVQSETTRLLLRRASAIAGRLNTNWFAVYVRTKKESPAADVRPRAPAPLRERDARDGARREGRLARRARTSPAELLRFAREQGVTLAIFGKSRRGFRPAAWSSGARSRLRASRDRGSTSTRWRPPPTEGPIAR